MISVRLTRMGRTLKLSSKAQSLEINRKKIMMSGKMWMWKMPKKLRNLTKSKSLRKRMKMMKVQKRNLFLPFQLKNLKEKLPTRVFLLSQVTKRYLDLALSLTLN